MGLYKLTAKGNYGDIPKGYELQVPSSSSPTPNGSEIREVIKRLGFNSQAESYSSSGNWDVVKVS